MSAYTQQSTKLFLYRTCTESLLMIFTLKFTHTNACQRLRDTHLGYLALFDGLLEIKMPLKMTDHSSKLRL